MRSPRGPGGGGAGDWVILGTYIAAALVVVALTRGRLGQRDAVPSVSATTSG
jgi:hypothetical protein